MAQMSMTAGVSFAKTPAIEVSKKAGKIEKLGWREVGRGDPWVISYRKDVPMHTADPEAEIRDVMGEYWVTADEIGELLNQRQ